jgi:O-antigen/teichoic acid export membrane protein
MARNTLWNLIGQALPLILAAACIPFLIRHMGMDRFGVLTLAWVLVGYFGLFDLGLGRALTKVVSESLAEGDTRQAAAQIWTALLLLFACGIVFALPIVFSCGWIVSKVFRIPAPLIRETTAAVYILAASIPLITLSTGLRGSLEAQHRFGAVNSIRALLGASNFLGPLIAVFWSPNLALACAILVVGRATAAALFLVLCLKRIPAMRHRFACERRCLPALLSTGAWITVSNLISPVITYSDRFLISFFLSVSVVAYYTTPSEVVTKLLIVPGAITAVLFPAFAALSVLDRGRLAASYSRGVRACFLLMFPAVFTVMLFSPEALRLWVGAEFAARSTAVLRLLLAGLFLNSLAHIPFVLLQAVNRPDLPGKLHLLELVPYLAAAAFAIRYHGIAGAAMVWALRLSIEAMVLLWMAAKTLVPGAIRKDFVLVVVIASAVLASSTLPWNIFWKFLWCVAVLATFIIVSWNLVLEAAERKHIRSTLVGLINTKSAPGSVSAMKE